MRGRRNPNKPQSSANLPPCRVCGELGTGFHYGVTTCGACKGFFRRSLVRHDPYVCTRNHLCHMGPSTMRRQSCPKCRYNKCVALGMCREACKVGRYSLGKKARDMRDVLATNHPTLVTTSDRRDTENSASCSQYPDSSTAAHSNSEVSENCSGENQHDTKTRETKAKLLFPDGDEHMLNSLVDENQENGDVADSCTNDEETFIDSKHYNSFLGSPSSDEECENNSMNNQSMEYKHSVSTTTKGCYDVLNNQCGISLEKSKNSKINTKNYTRLSYPDFDEANVSSIASHKTNRTVSGPRLDLTIQKSNSLNLSTLSLSDWDRESTKLPQCPHVTNENLLSSEDLSQTENDEKMKSRVNEKSNQLPFLSSPTAFLPLKEEDNLMDDIIPCKSIQGIAVTPFDMTQQSSSSNNYTELFKAMDSCGHRVTTSKDSQQPSESEQNFSKSVDSNLFQVSQEEENIINSFHSVTSKRCSNQQLVKTENATAQNSQIKLYSNNKRQFPFSQFDEYPESKPIVLRFVSPDHIKYMMSVYEGFPFKCYEQNTLATLLKDCYPLNDDLEENFSLFWTQLIKQNETHQNKSMPAITNGDESFFYTSILSFDDDESPQKNDHNMDYNYIHDDPEMDELFDRLEEVNCRFYGPRSSHMSKSDITQAHDMFNGICQLQQKLQGPMNFIDDDKYYKVLKETGVDVDKRGEWLSVYMENLDVIFGKHIKFFRAIPGFKEFTLNDRTSLAKSCISLYQALGAHRGIDLNRNILIHEVTKHALKISTLYRIIPNTSLALSIIFRTLRNLQALDLSYEEIILSRVLIVVNPDLCNELEKREIVTSWRSKYLKCLRRITRKEYGPGSRADERFQNILGVLKSMIAINESMWEAFHNARGEIKRMSRGTEEPLFDELYATK